jgi:uncharacterized OB-fold protein
MTDVSLTYADVVARDEAKIDLDGKQEKVIMIKCQSCGRLNEEDSKF